MASGDFLSDLSEGIFSRQSELRSEQLRRDDARKQETLALLTNLAGQVEPNSLPTLMRHIGDVMGVKGKMKKFWDSFSGYPDRSVEDQLGSRLSEVMGGLVGPEAARKTRFNAAFSGAVRPQNMEQAQNIQKFQDDAAAMTGKMVLRDPRAERLEDLKAQYGLQFQQRQTLQDRQAAAIAERQRLNDERDRKTAEDLAKQRAEIAEQKKQNELAGWLIGESQGRLTMPDALMEAQRILAGGARADVNIKQARVPLVKNQAAKVKAETDFMTNPPAGVPKGMKPSQAANLDLRLRGLDQAQQQQADAMYEKWGEARAAVVAAEQSLAQAQMAVATQAQAFGAKYDPATNTFINSKTGQPLDPVLASFLMKKLAPVAEAKGKIEAALSQMGTLGNTLQSRYKNYYKAGAPSADPRRTEINPNKEFGGVAPGATPRTAPGATPTPAKPGRQRPVAPVKAPTSGAELIPPGKQSPEVRIKTAKDWERAIGSQTSLPGGQGATSWRGTKVQRWDDPKFKQKPDGSFPEFEVDGVKVRVTGTQPPDKDNPYGRIFYTRSQPAR